MRYAPVQTVTDDIFVRISKPDFIVRLPLPTREALFSAPRPDHKPNKQPRHIKCHFSNLRSPPPLHHHTLSLWGAHRCERRSDLFYNKGAMVMRSRAPDREELDSLSYRLRSCSNGQTWLSLIEANRAVSAQPRVETSLSGVCNITHMTGSRFTLAVDHGPVGSKKNSQD